MPTEGQGVTYTIDKTTPLPDLIKRLDNWKSVETGKAYFIGYTQDMFSIAAHGDSALPLLHDYIKSSTQRHAKAGALLAIYLIGIDSEPRDDSFCNIAARQLLLDFLSAPDCSYPCATLLMRDAWLSDVPTIIHTLIQSNPPDWVVMNALVYHYPLDDLPVANPIPRSILDQQVFVPEVRFKNVKDYPLAVIKFLCETKPAVFKMDPALLAGIEPNVGAWGPDHTSSIASVLDYFNIPPDRHPVSRYMHIWDEGYKFEYYFKDSIVYFCTPQTALDRLRGWYLFRQQQFTVDKAARAKTLALLQDNAEKVRALNRQIDDIKLPDVSQQMLAAMNASPGAKLQLPTDFTAKQKQLDQLVAQKQQLLQQRRALNL